MPPTPSEAGGDRNKSGADDKDAHGLGSLFCAPELRFLINHSQPNSFRPFRGPFLLENRMPKWRNEYRRCDNCRSEYRAQREAQSYCSRDCRRAPAYGRERFKNGTKGRRKRRLEASDKSPATLVAGSFRKGDFSSIETGCYGPTNWIEKLNQRDPNEIDRAYRTREKRKWPVDLMGGARHSDRRPTLTVDPKLRQTILDTE